MIKEKDINDFFKAIDSLKKYRRADLLDTSGKSLIKKLYVDPMPNSQILKNCLTDNTTFLIGRKGTGKSTLFLRIEQEYLSRKDYISCYIDAKTTFETGISSTTDPDYLGNIIPKDILDRYLMQRSFVQNILKQIVDVIDKKYSDLYHTIRKGLGMPNSIDVKEKLEKLSRSILDNDILQKIELPIVTEINRKISNANSFIDKKAISADVKANPQIFSSSLHVDDGKEQSFANEWEDQFSRIFLKLFQIQQIIIEIKDILSDIGIRHLVVMLDDFSEIEEHAITNVVDSVIMPLNNWSDEFIKFKVAVYPGRIHYGKIDKGKIDTIDLDFYNLYNVDRSLMEDRAIDFTKRIVEGRVNYFCKIPIDSFFDTKEDMESYYELLFQTSMNIPRILGYILYYSYQTTIAYGQPINRKAIENAAQKYYEDNIFSFFENSTYSLMTYENKVSILQQKELLDIYITKMKDIKRKIQSGELQSTLYNTNAPYTSHFYIAPTLEPFLSTLELNFFITKYGEMSDRDGRKVSIYALNYGLTAKHNLRWGKQKGSDFRKYYIARPFDFTADTEDYLKQAKQLVCTNPQCGKTYPYDYLDKFKFFGMKCQSCLKPVKVVSISETIKVQLEKIDQSHLLDNVSFSLLHELVKADRPLLAREIAEELDFNSRLISKRAKKLEEEKQLVKRSKENESDLYTYNITDLARDIYFGR